MAANGIDVDYDRFDRLMKMRLKVEETVSDGFRWKESKFRTLIEETINKIKELGFILNGPTSSYNISFSEIMRMRIKEVVCDWDGPCIPIITIDTMSDKEFVNYGRNYVAQNICKVSGKYLFAPHIRASRSYILRVCDSIVGKRKKRKIVNISELEQQYVAETMYKIFAVKILEKMVKHNRTKKPLIPHKALRESDDILAALGELDSSLNLAQDSERNQKSKEFAKKIKEIARKSEKQYLDILRNIDNDDDTTNNDHNYIAEIPRGSSIPSINTNYYQQEERQQYQQYGTSYNRDNNDVDIHNNEINYISPPPKPNPPPQASLSPNRYPADYIGSNKSNPPSREPSIPSIPSINTNRYQNNDVNNHHNEINYNDKYGSSNINNNCSVSDHNISYPVDCVPMNTNRYPAGYSTETGGNYIASYNSNKPNPPSLPLLLPTLPETDSVNNNSSGRDCCYTFNQNIPYPAPVLVTNENRYCGGYGNEHGGNYIGSASHFRYSPCNSSSAVTFSTSIPSNSANYCQHQQYNNNNNQINQHKPVLVDDNNNDKNPMNDNNDERLLFPACGELPVCDDIGLSVGDDAMFSDDDYIFGNKMFSDDILHQTF